MRIRTSIAPGLLSLAMLLGGLSVSDAQTLPGTDEPVLIANSHDSLVTITWTNLIAPDSVEVYANGDSIASVIAPPQGSTSVIEWVTFGLLGASFEIEVVAIENGIPLPAETKSIDLCPATHGAAPPPPTPGHAIPNDELFGNQWDLHGTGQFGDLLDRDMDLPQAWTIETGSPDVIVAMLDGGTAWDHPDLRFRLTPGYNFDSLQPDPGGMDPFAPVPASTWDPAQYDPSDPSYVPVTEAISGHGVIVSGIIGAERNNTIGMAGIAGGTNAADGVRLMPLVRSQVIRTASSPVFSTPVPVGDPLGVLANYVADGLEYATYLKTVVGAPIRVVNSTIPTNFADNPALLARMENAVQGAWDAGILIVQAAGNYGDCETGSSVDDMATLDLVLAVANLDRTGTRQYSSSCGPEIDLAAPGSQMISTTNAGNHDPSIDSTEGAYSSSYCGTSFAAPHVSGVAALLFSYDPTLTNAQVWQILEETADDTLPAGWDEQTGWGRVNAYRALLNAAGLPDLPGDVNDDGMVNIADVIGILVYFSSGTPPSGLPLCIMDTNGDGQLGGIADAIALINYLFAAGWEPTVGCPIP